MRARFTQSFKIQAVEKALERASGVTIKDIADHLGVGRSTLGKWIVLAQKAVQQLISAGKPGEGLRKLLKASYLFESVDRDIQLHRLFARAGINSLLKSKITNRFNDYLYLTVNDGLSRILSEQNYHVVTADEGYAGNTDYVVNVQANAVTLPGYGGIQFVKFNGVVGVRSNQTGRMLKTIRINSEATKAGGLSLEVAAEKAAAKLVDAVRNDLLQTLEKNLGRQ